MKKIYIIKRLAIVLLLSIGMLMSCSEEFLNPVPNASISSDEVFESTNTVEAALVGLYDQLSSYAFEGLYLPIMSDLMGEDLMLNSVENYNWFVAVYQMNVLPNYQYASNPWDVGYKLIFDANLLLANVNKVPDATPEEIDNIVGQAKAMRAFTMLKLVEMFAPSYKSNPDAPGILLVTTPLAWDAEDIGRSTIREVYEQIVNDLTSAVELLDQDDYTGFFDQRAAQAILARAYLNMEEWELASEMASLACDGKELMHPDELLYGFTAPSRETIFSVAYTEDDNNIYLSLPSFYWPVSGYSSMRADSVFVNMFNDSDWRKGQFHFQDDIDPDNYLILKFMHDSKIGNAEKSSIRSSEMYLIIAECQAELGNYSVAQDTLYSIQSRAYGGVSKSTATGQELIDEILIERRKELYGEGFRLNDIKRREAPFIREGQHWAKFNFSSMDYDYYRLTFPIPQGEIDANSLLTQADQNIGY